MKTPTVRLPDGATHKSRIADHGQTEKITLTRSAFASLLNGVLYPTEDDSGSPGGPFGPYGPGGPVMQRLLWAALNPQPLPPSPDPYMELSWAALNPQPLPPSPDPYRAAFAARAVITRAAAQYEMVEVLSDEQSERGIIIVSGRVNAIVDEWCGTPVPRQQGPRPHPLALLAAGVQFQKAADAMRNSRLQSVLANAAGKLFTAGLARMENAQA